MSQSHGQLKLGLLFNAPGNDPASTSADERNQARQTGLAHYIETTLAMERARFDFVMVADVAFQETAHPQVPRPEPITLFAALAGVTRHIGLVPTVSTTFTAPFNLARQMLSLDNLSGGRAAWNVVTSSAGERNFGNQPLPLHSERYRRALEHVEVVRKLWDSWQDDALVNDHGRHIAVDAGRIHRIAHQGEFYQVEGPLNLSRSPQGHPVLFQAGSSADGKAFAAHFAEAIYTAQHSIAEGKRFYDDLKSQVRHLGRDPAHINILPGLSTVIADSDEAARRLNEQILDNLGPQALDALAKQLGGIDLSDLEPHHTIPAERLPAVLSVEGRQSRYEVFRQHAVEQRWTLRQLLELQAGSAGHGRIVGSPERVADHIERWFLQGAADGFIVMPGQGLEGALIFAEQVVPILQRRGLFRNEYQTDTLRGHLGLPIPRSRYNRDTELADQKAGVPAQSAQ
ncbi:NtaA/DmoA family FMN-dependent monooxygenase [Phytopseudomonas daroniae]|uniref:NtaA/DmoA family FMN-dependent monooxygenase n=1 Tax=Phytopseudomonas daroniae TaxID=2487519 RepID=UPI0010384099|nr:NtaA/DmoA family FMN-dependent monooxygenase [Pseudomonas daroniae]TBU73519.1 FMN-dependent monooxygenase [Pseudomonas daroniae]